MKTTKVYVQATKWNVEQNDYTSVCIPTPFNIVVMVSNPDQFSEIFGDSVYQQLVIQNLHKEVTEEYLSDKSFPKRALAAYGADCDAIFEFHHLERDEWGEILVAYYEYIPAIS